MKQFSFYTLSLHNRSMRKNSAINIRNNTLPPVVRFPFSIFTFRTTNTTQIYYTCVVTQITLEATPFLMVKPLQKAIFPLSPTLPPIPPSLKCISRNTFLPLVQSAFTKSSPMKLPGLNIPTPLTHRFGCSGFPREILRECWRSFSVGVSSQRVGPAPRIPCFSVSTVRKTWNEHWQKTGLIWTGVSLVYVVVQRRKWGWKEEQNRGNWRVSRWIRGRKKGGKMKRRNYLLKENEIYKKAPVKRFSVCTWIAEWLFGLWSVCCYERLFFLKEEK